MGRDGVRHLGSENGMSHRVNAAEGDSEGTAIWPKGGQGREDKSGEGASEEEEILGSKSLLSFAYFAASLHLSMPHLSNTK